MPRMLLRASVLLLLWSQMPAHIVMAQGADDDIVVQNAEPARKGISAWWHKVTGKSQTHEQAAAPVYQSSPIIQTGGGYAAPVSMGAVHPEAMLSPAPNVIHGSEMGVSYLNPPLYPSPVAGVPLNVGATMITNEALHPHEMLYPHEYRSLYGPYYYKTKRAWVMTPLGIYKMEKRVLTGTQVKVKYKSHVSPFTLFYPK